MSGAPVPSSGYSAYGGRGGSGSGRSYEERLAAKEQMMQSVRESSQQDRRVYVGNLSYDVKWHHLKDFMRQGEQRQTRDWGRDPLHWRGLFADQILVDVLYSWRCDLRRCVAASEWNVEGGRQCVVMAGSLICFFFLFLWLKYTILTDCWVDGLGLVVRIL